MKKVFLVLIFVLFSTPSFAKDYWVYIRMEDRFGPTEEKDSGRSKKGDVVDIREADYEPSDKEKSEWAIVKVRGLNPNDINDFKSLRIDENANINAYRKKTINVNALNLKKGLNEGIFPAAVFKSNASDKTPFNIAVTEFKRKFWLAMKPFRDLDNKIVKNAYAGTNTSTINWASQDYDTCTLWEDATDNDLVATTTIEVGEFYNDDGDVTENCIFSGAVSNSSYYQKLTSPAGERHNGTDNGGATIIAGSLQNEALRTFVYVIIEYMIIDNSGVSSKIGISVQNGSWGAIIRNNVIHGATSGIINGYFANAYIQNNIIYESTTGVYVDTVNFSDHGQLLNNTIADCTNGVAHDSDSAFSVVKNNLSVNNSSADYSGKTPTTANKNLSSDTTAWGTTNYQSKTITFVDDTNDDYHLDPSETDAIDKGEDLGSTSNVNLDIDNYDRSSSATWDVGADEIVESAGTSPRVIIISKLR